AANVASVQFMITNQMKERLQALGYASEEIAALHPERASAIVSRGIVRPKMGVPASWTRASSNGPLQKLRPAVG
ncbi:MAG: hypothetical protein SGPRY_012352, partial [Prymnesium sp.]